MNNILVIAVANTYLRVEDKEKMEDNILKSLEKGVLIKDNTISNLYVIDKDKKEMITLVY